MSKTTFSTNAGIAIGPILFIVAVLAIIASAIAASSSSFSGGNEANKAKAAAIVQAGETIKMGMDFITIKRGMSPVDVDVSTANTSGETALFSPLGGGIHTPSVSASNNPLFDLWYFPVGAVPGFGSDSENDVLAVLPVSRGVCAEINNLAFGVAAVPPNRGLGDFVSGVLATLGWLQTANAGWTVGVTATTMTGPAMYGAAIGCLYNDDVTLGANCPPGSCSIQASLPAIPGLVSPAYALSGGGEVGSCDSSCESGPSSPFFFYQVIGVQ